MDKRAIAEQEAQRDVDKTREHLLADIHDESLDRGRPGTETVSRTTARFASLLVVLSKQADKQFLQNLRIQKWLIGLTVALVILTIALLVLTWRMVTPMAGPNNLVGPTNALVGDRGAPQTLKGAGKP